MTWPAPTAQTPIATSRREFLGTAASAAGDSIRSTPWRRGRGDVMADLAAYDLLGPQATIRWVGNEDGFARRVDHVVLQVSCAGVVP